VAPDATIGRLDPIPARNRWPRHYTAKASRHPPRQNGTVKRVALVGSLLALASLGAACGLDSSPQPVRDGTGILVQPASPAVVGCPIDLPPLVGDLLADPGSGVAIETGTERVAIVWPSGYHARTVAGVVEILDDSGAVVARTGVPIRLEGIRVDGRWLASPCQPPFGSPRAA
jgi:hypothetical protein